MSIPAPDIESLHRGALATGRRCCAAAVIFDAAGRIFSPRRASSAPSMPDLRDLVGGHLEPGESVLDGLRREVFEETGWTVVGRPRLIFVCDWELPQEPGDPRREFDFVTEVDGPLDRPKLAPEEHSTWRWVARDEAGCFDENAGADLGLVRRIAEAAWASRGTPEPSLPHAAVFLEPVPAVLRDRRTAWDPVAASRIAPHVTVAYPSEVNDLADLTERVARAATATRPFRLTLGAASHDGDPDRGITVAVDDVDGGWRDLRAAVTTGSEESPVDPHVTLVHPRTSGLGATAWSELSRCDFSSSFTVTSVAVTAYDGDRWSTTSRHELG